jgi:hypothetical protein
MGRVDGCQWIFDVVVFAYNLIRTNEMSQGKFGEIPTLTRNRKSGSPLKSDYLIHS